MVSIRKIFALCINKGSRVYNVLRKETPMVRFQCDGKILVRKTKSFFGFCVEVSSYFAKILARII